MGPAGGVDQGREGDVGNLQPSHPEPVEGSKGEGEDLNPAHAELVEA